VLKTDREYTKNMQKAVNSSQKLTFSQLVGFIYAGILTALAVAQLFKFDEFIDLISKNSRVGGEVAFVLAAMIVVFEIFAIPYLVEMRTLRPIKLFSLICVLMAGMFWIVMSFSIGIIEPVADIGLLGTVIPIKSGIEAMVCSLFIAGLSIFMTRKFLFIVKN
jgi:hypothetical protein